MDDVKSINQIVEVGGRTSSSSINDYRQWLFDQGHMPLHTALPRHPGELINTFINKAGDITNNWEATLDRIEDRFSESNMRELTQELRHDRGYANPGEVTPVSESVFDKTSHSAPMEGENAKATAVDAAEHASTMIRETTAKAIESQWRQTVLIVEHGLSTNILSASIEASISTSKKFQDGINAIMRG